MAEEYRCCIPFAQLVSQEEYCPTFRRDENGHWVFGGDGAVMRVCPFCATPVPEPWYDPNEIMRINTELANKGAMFTYLTREQTNHLLSYGKRDNPKRDTPQGRWSCYRILYEGKYRWRDRTTLRGDQRLQTTVHDEMRGPNFGARVTEDAIYVIFED